MAAYGAAISLKNTIQRVLHSSRISLVPPSPQILQPAYDAMDRLQKVMLKLEGTGYSKIRKTLNALDERIKEVVWEFEDLLETHFTNQILPRLECSSGGVRDQLSFSVDLQSLRQSVDCFVERVTAMKAEYDIELLNMPEEEGEPVSSRIDFGGINSEMVGLSDQFERVRDYLAKDEGHCISVIGMAGVGKTTLAKKVFDDESIGRHFHLRAWVKVGRKCKFNETLQCIIAQVDPNNQMFTPGDDDGDDKLVGILEERLKNIKCLIVLDDVWAWDSRLMDRFRKMKTNVRILLTSRQRIKESTNIVVRFMNEEESRKLLGDKVFGEEGFPPYLEKLGEKIAEKCDGLPLMIVTVAGLLSKEDKTPKNWTLVAEKQHSSIFVDAYNQISEVFFPSYDYLPQYLKMFFLYLGAYPPFSKINIHSLFHLLSAEGFLEPIREQTLDDFIIKCTKKLAHWYHLVIYESNPESWFLENEFRVHSCWQHLCKKESSKIKFLHVLQSCDDVIKEQRRLCAHSNALFGFKEVYDSIKNDCASTTRSLLCFGPCHHYQVPIHAMDFKLLRVLDAVFVRFYHLPLEILKLVCLKYLSLTYNKELPDSISNLFHLQVLIIYQHMYIIKRGKLSYMPVEIWDMQELQLINVLGRELPAPKSDGTLDKLSSLVGVSAKSCTRTNLKRMPNLKKLGVFMELKPYDDDDDDTNPFSGLDYISKELQNLEVLMYRIMNPQIKYEFMVSHSMFPSSLKKLILNALGYPWKHMNVIGSLLPNLSILKLEHYAFRGPKWDIGSGCFLKLKTLLIEDTDLVRWRVQHGSLPQLELLSIRHCYKLQQLDWMRDPSMVKTTIELVECNPLVVASSKQLRPISLFIVRCHSSF